MVNRKKKLHQRRKLKKSLNASMSLTIKRIGCFSFPKNEENTINEDAVRAEKSFFTVSDGAGGGGVFADLWANLLVSKLTEKPICTVSELNLWLDSFVDDFYTECEEKAKRVGGLFLDKFYDEGSFATLSAVWKTDNNKFSWLMYGDSTVFCYNKNTRKLWYSVPSLSEFDQPPFLLNTISATDEKGFKSGTFSCDEDSVIFVCSDAISHFLLMLYAVEHKEENCELRRMLDESLAVHTKTANFVGRALLSDFSFDFVLEKLCSSDDIDSIKSFLYTKEKEGLLGHDDYSFAFAEYGK